MFRPVFTAINSILKYILPAGTKEFAKGMCIKQLSGGGCKHGKKLSWFPGVEGGGGP